MALLMSSGDPMHFDSLSVNRFTGEPSLAQSILALIIRPLLHDLDLQHKVTVDLRACLYFKESLKINI
jgi:hypothetical protein